jgi:glycosyltransferase involved in cell wall biosynthesis
VEFVKKSLEEEGHQCIVLNIGTSRMIPSTEYETVAGGADFVRKVWRFSRQGFVVHAHANGDAIKGALLALAAMLINLAHGRRPVLTFHAGAIQRYFPRERSWRHVPLYWLLFTVPRRVICNSEVVKACIRGYGVPEEKIVPIAAFSRQYLDFSPVALPEALERFFLRHPSVVFTYIRLRHLFFPLTLIDGVAKLAARRDHVGVVLCGASGGHFEPELRRQVEARIEALGLADRLCILEDLDHDAFLTALRRSAVYLRTPITDGVASSVLESLALGVPVVACENGTRPAGVVTYPAEDSASLADAVAYVLDHRDEVVRSIAAMEVDDTVADEVRLLTQCGHADPIAPPDAGRRHRGHSRPTEERR